jgi:1-acyl-sn-glycerol-3-phosphate acyltransferase
MDSFLSLAARGILRLTGWRISGEEPPLQKAVVVAAFHTTNWDGIMLVLAMMALKVHIVWVVKKELMWFPLDNAMRALGALPIDRLGSQGVTDFLVDEFNRRDHMILVLSPEGTRHKVTRWRRGFYVIAERARVPIVLSGIDYQRKVMGFGPTFTPSGDLDRDVEILRSFYKDFTPKYPENAGEIAFTRSRDAVE